MEAPLRRGRHLGAVHRVRGLRDRVPARRARLRRHRAASTSRSSSRTTAARRLQPRREGLHVVHPGLPALPGVGARDRRVPVRPGPRGRRAVAASSRTSCLARAADPVLHEVGQDGGLVSAMLVYALEHDIIDAALVSYLEGDGTTWKAIPGVARTARRHHRVGRQPLHVLREHARVHRPREGRRADRARRHELPVVDAAGDEAAQGGQGRAPPRR